MIDPHAAARSVQDPAPRLRDVDGVDQHDGQGRVPRPVDVRDDRPGDGDRPRRPHARHRPRRAAAAQPAVAADLPFTVAGRQACSTRSRRWRRSSRRWRCSTTTRSGRSRRRRGPRVGCSASASACTSSRRRWTRRRWPPRAATVRVEASGKVVAYLGTTSHGQSVETTMAQIVADTLGVAYDDVTVVQADTQSTPYGPGTGGSRTAVVAGGAARGRRRSRCARRSSPSPPTRWRRRRATSRSRTARCSSRARRRGR